MTRALAAGCVLGVLAGVGACVGEIGGGPDKDGATGTAVDPCTAFAVPMRRLSGAQYANTIDDLFAGAVTPGAQFPASSKGYMFKTYVEANGISLSSVESIMKAAEDVALQAVTDMNALLPCDPASADDACIEQFVRDFGRRAYRRPLSDDELSNLMGAYDGAEGNLVDRIALVISTVLQMPQFLYLIEEGTPNEGGRTVALTDHEIAARLSYLVWASMPDEALLAAAEAREVHTTAQIEGQVRRMLADRARSAPALVAFVEQWMGLDSFADRAKSATVFPDYAALAPHLVAESQRFIEHVWFDGDGTVGTLLTSDVAFVNAPLETFYGLPAQSAGDGDWLQVSLDPQQRPGLLTRPATIATYSHSEAPSPTLRGQFIRTRVMCQQIQPPPLEATTVDPQGNTLVEQSQWLIDHTFCGGCHALMDGIGVGLMNYDASGQWDATQNVPGEIRGLDDGTFSTPAEMVSKLAATDVVADCAVKQMFRYTVARDDVDDDACLLETFGDALAENGGDMRELIVAIVTSDAFTVRVLEEVQP